MKKILFTIILIFTIISFTGCSNNSEENLNTKVISELDYLDGKIIGILNKLNNISFESYSIVSEKVKLSAKDEKAKTEEKGGEGSKNNDGTEKEEETEDENKTINSTNMVVNTELNKNRNDINWDELKEEIEEINSSWAIVILDLYTLNASNNTILEFSEQINNVMIEIKAENKQNTLNALAKLYSDIPKLLKEINIDENKQKIRQTQSYVIEAYILAEDMSNTQISNNVMLAINEYSEIMSNIDYTKDKSEKTNKIYVLLNELSNSVIQKDEDVFYIKYKNFMKEIETL